MGVATIYDDGSFQNETIRRTFGYANLYEECKSNLQRSQTNTFLLFQTFILLKGKYHKSRDSLEGTLFFERAARNPLGSCLLLNIFENLF